MTNYATMSGIYAQTAAALRRRHGTSLRRRQERRFLLPATGHSATPIQRLKLFLSPDGKALMIITHDGDPRPRGISHIDAIRHAAGRP
jgi:RND superfamily putative drug exporter